MEDDKIQKQIERINEALSRPSVRAGNEARKKAAEKLLELPSPNQRKFVTDIIHGRDMVEAVAEAYPDTSERLLRKKALELLRHPKIKEIVEILKKEVIPEWLTTGAMWVAIPTLLEVAEGGKSEKARVAAAIAILNFGLGTPPKQILVQTVNWHGGFDKSFLRNRMRENINKNLKLRGEEEIIDVEDESVSGD